MVTSWMRTIHGLFQTALMAYQMRSMLRLPYQHQVTVARRRPTSSKVLVLMGDNVFYHIQVQQGFLSVARDLIKLRKMTLHVNI